MRILHSKNALLGMKNIQLDICDYGKQKRKWKALIANETGNKIKYLKSDNGGEYLDGGFQEYCSNNSIRVFGCIAYAHIDKEERKKLDSKSQKCVFIGYGDDILVADSNIGRIKELKKKLASTFSKKDLGEAKQLLGMRITRDKKNIWLSPEEYIEKVFTRFNLHTSKTVMTPLAANFTLSKELTPRTVKIKNIRHRFTTNPGKEHWQAVKWILRYLKGTSMFCLCFEGNNIDVQGYADADHAVDCKLWTDSQTATHLAKNSAFHSRTKHIQLRYHFIRSLLEDGQLNMEKIEGNKNPTDMLTKVVKRKKLSICSTLIRLH
ncbi:hypothetical protein RJ639_016338 [Escallonia herrerae]|uniref:Reverse transcriptase Ty1/copia-type domain-containing protein n=1 Tax=Escallonia herrerae TaxID=1293975 RepID=A0AA88VB75_9ASTE|nr:hypothetical protein RJ639_016338 [Escallonia herrerae]